MAAKTKVREVQRPLHVIRERIRRWDRALDEAQRFPNERESRDAGGQRNEDGFADELPDDPESAGAEREPHRDLPLPCDGTRECEVGDVRARDEK